MIPVAIMIAFLQRVVTHFTSVNDVIVHRARGPGLPTQGYAPGASAPPLPAAPWLRDLALGCAFSFNRNCVSAAAAPAGACCELLTVVI